MTHHKLTLLLGFLLLVSCTTTTSVLDNITPITVKEPLAIVDKNNIKPLAIARIIAKIAPNAVVGEVGTGQECLFDRNVKWHSHDRIESKVLNEDFIEVFNAKLEMNNWPIVGSSNDLFDQNRGRAEILVAGKINDLQTNICYVDSFGESNEIEGATQMSIEWQIYSPTKKLVIGTVQTQGSASTQEVDSYEYVTSQLLIDGFANNVNNLLASPEFMKMVSRSPLLLNSPDPDKHDLINNKSRRYNTTDEAIEAAKKSTVTVRSSTSHGSGFAIGDGTLILTNSHVVGEADNVTLVTKEGLSIDAKVIRKDKARDVALVRMQGLALPPLHINTALPKQTDKVFAIGTPFTEQLVSSVTSGIVSGTRTMEGFEWIQSDTAVSPGNSGGPLLNSRGSVIAISTLSFSARGSQVGLNLFIPIQKALNYVNLKIE